MSGLYCFRLNVRELSVFFPNRRSRKRDRNSTTPMLVLIPLFPMPEDLIQFWCRCHFTGGPCVHPDDLPILQESGWKPGTDPTSFEDFVSGQRFGNLADGLFHLSLFPVPYVGDLRHAPVVILLLNPGFGYSDYWAEFKVPEFRVSLERNLRQSFDHTEFPFLFLDPQFCWHGGFIWWEGKLRDVIRRIADLRFSGRYLPALRFMSQNLACVELFPYHSAFFAHHGLIQRLPSAVQARSFACDHLIPSAIARQRTVIVTRQKKGWGAQNSEGDLVVYEGGHTRGASLSTNSEGGKAILRRLCG